MNELDLPNVIAIALATPEQLLSFARDYDQEIEEHRRVEQTSKDPEARIDAQAAIAVLSNWADRLRDIAYLRLRDRAKESPTWTTH